MNPRAQLIDEGRIWQVSPDKEPDNILFEGTKTKCMTFIRINYGMKAYKKGTIRIGQVIWEAEMSKNSETPQCFNHSLL